MGGGALAPPPRRCRGSPRLPSRVAVSAPVGRAGAPRRCSGPPRFPRPPVVVRAHRKLLWWPPALGPGAYLNASGRIVAVRSGGPRRGLAPSLRFAPVGVPPLRSGGPGSPRLRSRLLSVARPSAFRFAGGPGVPAPGAVLALGPCPAPVSSRPPSAPLAALRAGAACAALFLIQRARLLLLSPLGFPPALGALSGSQTVKNLHLYCRAAGSPRGGPAPLLGVLSVGFHASRSALSFQTKEVSTI